MILVALALFLIGLMLSAFFSGSETGFYRVTRVRLVLDARDGDVIARLLLFLSNYPALFVATTLIGNNLANYTVSLAIVLAAQSLATGRAVELAELLGPVALSPLVYVYGELLPKNLFYYAPNRLLRRGGPVFMIFAILFAPLSGLLWAFGSLLQWLLGQTPLRLNLNLHRKELDYMLVEGQHAGILQPSQRELAQGLFAHGSQKLTRFVRPFESVAPVPLGSAPEVALEAARRLQVPVVPVCDGEPSRTVGYVRVIDLALGPAEKITQVRPLLRLSTRDSQITALLKLQQEDAELGEVPESEETPGGLVFARDLEAPLLQEPHAG